MEIDYIFPRRIFSPQNHPSAKILTERKTACKNLIGCVNNNQKQPNYFKKFLDEDSLLDED